MPPAALASISCVSGALDADRSSQAIFGACKVRAQISAMLPVALLSRSTEVLAAACSSRFLRSLSSGEREKASSVSGGFCGATSCFKAFFTVASSFCRAIGFSRKSTAPTRVASTAESIVPCPDIITTGIVSRPPADHSLSSEMPSVSGIQMSRRTRSGRISPRTRRASAAFSANETLCPSSDRISESSSRMPISSSTTRIFAIFRSLYCSLFCLCSWPDASGKRMHTSAPVGCRLLMRILPWCSSTIFLTIARPRPVPRVLVVT